MSPAAARPVLSWLTIALAGALIAAWGATCGIGGGLFAVPLLHYVLRLPLRASVATSLVLVAATTSAASVAEFLRDDGSLHLPTVGVLLVGSIVGTRIGFALALRIRTRALKTVFAVVLAGVAVKLMLEPEAAAVGPVGALDNLGLSAAQVAWVALTGFSAGIVAPLLGVGGGLVAVPSLFIVIEPLGYLGARASSIAMSMVNAWISILLYRKTGDVSWDVARPLALGALVGGVVGVWAVHHPGLVDAARHLLATTLGLAALRFGYDLRSRAARAQA